MHELASVDGSWRAKGPAVGIPVALPHLTRHGLSFPLPARRCRPAPPRRVWLGPAEGPTTITRPTLTGGRPRLRLRPAGRRPAPWRDSHALPRFDPDLVPARDDGAAGH